uniref:Uncharacterized protein n=1 Tax=Arundo donax TaxID=35708 RepID=A0A0A8Z939_ARUDO
MKPWFGLGLQDQLTTLTLLLLYKWYTQKNTHLASKTYYSSACCNTSCKQ